MPLRRTDLDAYSELVCFLETLGAVKTASALFSKDENLTDVKKCQFFYDQICALIRNADMVIIEVSTPSLRVGYEIAYAEAFSKPVLALHNTSLLLYEDQPLSPFLRGNQRITIRTYKNSEEAIAHCRAIFKKKCLRAPSRGVRIHDKVRSKRWTELRVQDLVSAEAGEVKNKMLWFQADDTLDAVITGLSLHRYLCAPVYNAKGKLLGLVDMQDVLTFVLRHVLSTNPKLDKTGCTPQVPVAARKAASASSLPPIQSAEKNPEVSMLAANIALMRKSGGILNSTYAREVMNLSKRNPCVPADPDTKVSKVMHTLAKGIYRVPIMNKGRVIRLLSQMAMCELLAEHVECWAEEANRTLPVPFPMDEVVQVSSKATALHAFSKIQNNAVSGAAVIDDQGCLIADLTPADLKSMKHIELLLCPVTRFTECTPIRQVLTITDSQTERVTLKRVVKKMVVTGAHRFYILNSEGKPSAALSITDVLSGFTTLDGLWRAPASTTTPKTRGLNVAKVVTPNVKLRSNTPSEGLEGVGVNGVATALKTKVPILAINRSVKVRPLSRKEKIRPPSKREEKKM